MGRAEDSGMETKTGVLSQKGFLFFLVWESFESESFLSLVFATSYSVSDGGAMDVIYRFSGVYIQMFRSLIFYNQASFFQKFHSSLSNGFQ